MDKNQGLSTLQMFIGCIHIGSFQSYAVICGNFSLNLYEHVVPLATFPILIRGDASGC